MRSSAREIKTGRDRFRNKIRHFAETSEDVDSTSGTSTWTRNCSVRRILNPMGESRETRVSGVISSYIELVKPPFPDDRMNTPECLGVMLNLTNEYSGYSLVKSR